MRYWIRKIHKIFYFHSNLHFLVQNTGNTFGLTKDNIKIRLYLIVTMMITWTARRPNQAILKEISPEYSLEGLMLKLKFQYFGHLMQRTDLLEKTMMLGKNEGRKRRGWQRMRWLDGITDLMDMSLRKLWEVGDGQGRLACYSPWGHKESDTTEWLNCTESCASACALSSPAFRMM